MRSLVCLALALVSCGSATGLSKDAGRDDGGGTAGGGTAGGGTAGGGTAGGGTAGGGTAGGGTAGGGTAGGGTAGGGTAAGGSAGGLSGGGAGGGSSAGGAAGGSSGGAATDAGVVTLNGADTCSPSAPDVTAGGRFLGSTFSATDDYSVSGRGCPTGGAVSGRDVAYLLAPPARRDYRVRVTPLQPADGGVSRFDPMLFVQATCGVGECLAGTVFNGPGEPEEVSFTVNAGQTVFVVVDGELSSRGDFELDVSF